MPNIKPILDNDWHAILAIHWHLLYYQYLHWEILANVCMYEYIYMLWIYICVYQILANV